MRIQVMVACALAVAWLGGCSLPLLPKDESAPQVANSAFSSVAAQTPASQTPRAVSVRESQPAPSAVVKPVTSGGITQRSIPEARPLPIKSTAASSDSAYKGLRDCILAKVASMDDGVSPPSVIGQAASAACRPQLQEYIRLSVARNGLDQKSVASLTKRAEGISDKTGTAAVLQLRMNKKSPR